MDLDLPEIRPKCPKCGKLMVKETHDLGGKIWYEIVMAICKSVCYDRKPYWICKNPNCPACNRMFNHHYYKNHAGKATPGGFFGEITDIMTPKARSRKRRK